MVETFLIPWQHEAIVVKILTTRELSDSEMHEIELAYSKGRSPLGPYRTLSETIEKLKETNPLLAMDIIIPK